MTIENNSTEVLSNWYFRTTNEMHFTFWFDADFFIAFREGVQVGYA